MITLHQEKKGRNYWSSTSQLCQCSTPMKAYRTVYSPLTMLVGFYIFLYVYSVVSINLLHRCRKFIFTGFDKPVSINHRAGVPLLQGCTCFMPYTGIWARACYGYVQPWRLILFPEKLNCVQTGKGGTFGKTLGYVALELGIEEYT